MKSLRELFLASPCAEARPVDLPGGLRAIRVFVRPLSYSLLVGLRTHGEDIPQEAVPAIAANALCDEHGELLFDPDCEADLKLIGAKPTPALKAIVDAAIEASGADVEAAKKNSPPTPSCDGNSGSPPSGAAPSASAGPG